MRKLESLKNFQIDKAQQQQLKAGNTIYDYDNGTQQVGGGYCTSNGFDCQDIIYDDNGVFTGGSGPIHQIAPPNPDECYHG